MVVALAIDDYLSASKPLSNTAKLFGHVSGEYRSQSYELIAICRELQSFYKFVDKQHHSLLLRSVTLLHTCGRIDALSAGQSK